MISEIPSLDQLFDIGLLADHLDTITHTIGIPVYILKSNGEYISGDQYRYRQICGKFIKGKQEKCNQCKLMDFDMLASEISSNPNELMTYDCLPILDVFGSAINVGSKTIAVILAEKKKSDELSLSKLQDCAREAGLDTKTANFFIESFLILPTISPDKTKIVQKLISMIANSISQLASKEYSMRQSIGQMEVINEIVISLNRYRDIDLVLKFAVESIVNLTEARDGALFLWDESKRALVNFEKKDIAYRQIPERKGIPNRALDKRKPQRVDNVYNDPDYFEIIPNTRSELAIPLILGEIPIGVLDVQSDQLGHFTDEHERLLAMLAKHITAAIINTFVIQVAENFKNTRLIEELQKSTANKDELIRNLAHELKTPLTHIITFLEHLVNRSDSISNKEREFARIAYQEMWRYVRLVDKILTFSRILGKKLVLSKNSIILSDILRNSVDLCTPIAIDKGIDLQIDKLVEDSEVMADKDSITQIFVNLLDNAIKYTPNGGNIKIEMEERDDVYRIKINDNGIGISEMALRHIFEPYHSGDDAKPGQRGGLGIGLYIVKQLVEEHHGAISVESKLNEGTTFTFDLPKREAVQ